MIELTVTKTSENPSVFTLSPSSPICWIGVEVKSGVITVYDSAGKKHTGLVTAYDGNGKSHFVLISAYDSSGKRHDTQ